jgi:hypothetical protein
MTCPVCSDVRHTLPDDAYCFLPAAQVEEHVRTTWRQIDDDLVMFANEPSIGIGPCGYLILRPEGNIAFEMTGWYSNEALDHIQALGGVRFASASHPHAYGAMWQIQQRFRPEVAVQVEDLSWTTAFSATWPFDERLELLPGVELLHTGGHFAGHAVLYHAPRRTLFAGDALKGHFEGGKLIGISCHKAFNRQIPLTHAEIHHYRELFATLDFDTVFTTFEQVPVGRAAVLRLYDTLLAGRPTCEPIALT